MVRWKSPSNGLDQTPRSIDSGHHPDNVRAYKEAAHARLRERLSDVEDLGFLVQKYHARGLEVLKNSV